MTKLARTTQLAVDRKAAKKIILIDDEKRTMPPGVEDIWARSWFALYVYPFQEWPVARALRAEGFSTFLPVATYWNASRYRVRRQLERALLTRYVFVGVRGGPKLSDEDRASIRDTEGVQAVLGGSGGPICVPTENIVQLAGEIVEGYYDATKEATPRGATMTITAGPFSGFSATLDEPVLRDTGLDDPMRVIMKIMGRETLMHIPLANLVEIG